MKLKTIGSSIALCLLFVAMLALIYPVTNALAAKQERFATGFTGTLIALFLTWSFLRFQKKTFKDVGLNWESKTLKRFFKGFVLGLLIAILMVAGLLISTDLNISIAENHNITSFFFWTLAFIPLAFMEEVVFRGLPLIMLNKTLGLRLSIFLMAILFAFYHFDSNSLTSMLLGPGIWGIVYGIVAIWSDGISVPTGIHYAANVVLAGIGTKKEYMGIFEIIYEKEASAAVQEHTEIISIIVQIVLLIAALIVVEWYVRSKKQSKNVVYNI